MRCDICSGFQFSVMYCDETTDKTPRSWITQTQFHKSGQKKRQKLHCRIKYDNTSHEERLFPLPSVVGWVNVVAGACFFGGIFQPRALEPGGQ
jgi:hypothetical protein